MEEYRINDEDVWEELIDGPGDGVSVHPVWRSEYLTGRCI